MWLPRCIKYYQDKSAPAHHILNLKAIKDMKEELFFREGKVGSIEGLLTSRTDVNTRAQSEVGG